METKCIKNVDEETLKKFRDLNEKNSRNFWNEILFGEKLITDKEVIEFKFKVPADFVCVDRREHKSKLEFVRDAPKRWQESLQKRLFLQIHPQWIVLSILTLNSNTK